MDERAFTSLKEFMAKIPAIQAPIGTGADEDEFIWILGEEE